MNSDTRNLPVVGRTDCAGCDRLVSVSAGSHPGFISSLRETVAFLHDHQAYPGWVVLFLNDHQEHMHELSDQRWRGIADDLAQAAKAVQRATDSLRLNYECLGNQLAHIHWHIIPRFLPPIDPDPRNVVWVRPAAELTSGVNPDEQKRLISRIRDAGLACPQ